MIASVRGPGGLRAASGFTFVEVIVTSVIVAILAMVAVPMYTGYVSSQRTATLKSIAQMVAASASIYWRRTNIAPHCDDTAACVPLLGIYLSSPTQFKIEVDGGARTVKVTDLEHDDLGTHTMGF